MLQQSPIADHFPARSPTMSAECEAVPPQSLAANPMPTASPMTTAAKPTERHGSAGISYEGRVSLIPPLAGYEATMRAAMEMDRTHTRDHQMPMDTAHVHNERHYGTVQMQQDLRRLYEQRARMHEVSQLYSHREEQLRQAYPQSQETCTLKEEPINTSSEQENDANDIQMHDSTHLFPQSHQSSGESSYTSADQSPKPGQSQEVTIKEEPQQIDEQQAEAPEREKDHAHNESDTVLRFARPEHQAESTRSPIEKAGESPDLPTDSARTQSTEEQQQSFRAYDPSFKNNDSIERMSPFDENYHGSEEHMPSSVEPDGEDTMDSSMNPNEGDMDHLSRLQHAMQLSGVMSDKDGDSGDKPQVFQCHICSYSGTSRFHFNTHLNTHYDHKCMKCEFTTHAEAKLRDHMLDAHGISLDANEDLESIRVPRVNAQGKVKTFKCKQCEYVAITKSDFWEHARSHIKSEKLLTCPKCPFVTEYKHHLEYHLRNHFGSKPFKCNKCNYSCVNKSMLNSHMKSHSNIYQYRCSDCTYATKYCHSLKLHLRKYGHNPAMVLNPDGTPNPIPIIDVYGTRRGPKLKKDDKGMPILPPHYQIQAQILKAQMHASGKIAPSPSSPLDSPQPPNPRQPTPLPPTSQTGPPHSPFPIPYPGMMENFQNSSPILSRALKSSEEPREQLRELLRERERTAHINPLSPKDVLRCSLCDFVTDRRDMFSQHMMIIHATAERREDSDDTPRSPQPIERSSTPEHRSISPVRPPIFQHQPPPLTPNETGPLYSPLAAAHNLKEYLTCAMNPFFYQRMMSGQIHPAFGLQQHLQRFTHPVLQGPRPIQPEEDHRQPSPQISLHQTLLPNTDGVLDLSKEQTPLQQLAMATEHTPPQPIRDTSKEPPPIQQRTESRASLSPNHSSPQSSSPPRSETSTPPSKNRRKGRAFKLERIALRLSESAEGESSGHDEDMRREDDESQPKASENRMPPLMPMEQLDDPPEGQEAWQSAHQCQFCDMAFKDVVMYTMHMGYHGYRNPFTCNMCGHQATDKVAFFLHIARSSHS
ncbi:protein hunchback-like [Homarus americanus]|uniref:Protein hunchback n=1 Tax=Homarus americanus TaxID=6706 RepID=A0A8J5JTR5_HOMAM|nr:protein hunchback-like [Homarus americanus]XP_042230961.1 protein hunchback-like [Homarus americanus]KAG7164007.1 hunchback-like [Homarus americanus]